MGEAREYFPGLCDDLPLLPPTMSSPTEETPEISQEEQKKLDLEAAVKEKQEQDGKSLNLWCSNSLGAEPA